MGRMALLQARCRQFCLNELGLPLKSSRSCATAGVAYHHGVNVDAEGSEAGLDCLPPHVPAAAFGPILALRATAARNFSISAGKRWASGPGSISSRPGRQGRAPHRRRGKTQRHRGVTRSEDALCSVTRQRCARLSRKGRTRGKRSDGLPRLRAFPDGTVSNRKIVVNRRPTMAATA